MSEQNDRIQPLFTWRSAISSDKGPENPTTRHVLLAISLYMNEKGSSAFPSMQSIANDTGLNLRTVKKHVSLAVKSGWIQKTKKRLTGQSWSRNEYKALIPRRKCGESECKKVVNEVHEGGALNAPIEEKVVHEIHEGGASKCKKVVHEVHSNTPYNSPENSPARERARESENGSAGGKQKLTTADIYKIASTIDATDPEELPALLDDLFRRAKDRSSVLHIWMAYLKTCGKPVNNFTHGQLISEHRSTPLEKLKSMVRHSMARGYKSLVEPDPSGNDPPAQRDSHKDFDPQEYLNQTENHADKRRH